MPEEWRGPSPPPLSAGDGDGFQRPSVFDESFFGVGGVFGGDDPSYAVRVAPPAVVRRATLQLRGLLRGEIRRVDDEVPVHGPVGPVGTKVGTVTPVMVAVLIVYLGSGSGVIVTVYVPPVGYWYQYPTGRASTML